ncbi:hypothetical protein FRC08_008990 [Ceratobasidium sp. 394]|nr:hypothetical protein FRC08_008990 [Ceratobasidium sp. 394]
MHRLYTRSTALKSVLALAGGSLLTYHASDTRRIRVSLRTDSEPTPAEQQFRTSSLFPAPSSLTLKRWEIRNDYPLESTPDACSPLNAKWLQIDFERDPEAYANAVRSYCLEGMIQSDFDAKRCTTRDWYHAPWLHRGASGREPLRGLTSERPIPPYELARTQSRYLQIWACGFYNATAASVYGQMWNDPNNPSWEKDIQFPEGSVVFKVLMTDASDEDLPTQRGAPTWSAITSQTNPEQDFFPIAGQRNQYSSDVRLLQIDFAVRDTRAPIGWVFGAFMYDGRKSDSNPWYRTTPLGIQWGNDSRLTQERFDAGEKAKETWMNPVGEELRLHLGGFRPSWGWNGRLNGPVDNFASACASCHATASRHGTMRKTPLRPTVDADSHWRSGSADEMLWFQNTPSGKSIEKGAITADYSLQLQLGFKNYEQWRRENGETGSSRVGDALVAAIGPRRVEVPASSASSLRHPTGSDKRI